MWWGIRVHLPSQPASSLVDTRNAVLEQPLHFEIKDLD